MLASTDSLLKRAQLLGILELVCQKLELSEAQRSLAEDRYNTISGWLARADEPALRTSSIYPQGSIALQTTVKPIGQEEFDLDLVCHIAGVRPETPPAALKRLVGQRLREHGTYRDLLEEKPRCWRLNYADEFHLDMTPSIPNRACGNGGELVPDRRLSEWKASNPKGYRRWFDERAALRPIVLLERADMAETRAEIERLPVPSRLKGALRRSVQLCKRHRDVYFSSSPELAPISVVITTLAARSYAACAQARAYDTDLDLLLEIVRGMPSQIEVLGEGNRRAYFVWNDSTRGENFAEKWNQDSRLAVAFFEWHARALSDLVGLGEQYGLDAIHRHLGSALGESVVGRAMSDLTGQVSRAREIGNLAVISGVGLGLGPSSRGSSVRRNTFYGSGDD